MITCALTKDQINIVYKKVFKELSTKGQDFNPDSFMKELFDKIAKNSTPENAANFLQIVPSIIASQLITDFVGKINPSSYIANLYNKAAEYSNPDNFSNIITDLADADYLETLRNAKKQQEGKQGEVEQKEEGEFEESPRFKSPVVFGGTMIPFVTVDPKSKTALFPEDLDPEKKVLINTLSKISTAFSQSDEISKLVYQGQTLTLVGHNLNEFTTKENEAYMDKTTVAEVVRSRSMVKKNLTKAGVTQAFNRVILVVSNAKGEPIYFDENGNITDKEKGKLVYQFMKDVRLKGGKYEVTDVYDKGNIIQTPEEIAQKIYDKDIDGDYQAFVKQIAKDQQESFKQLYNLKEEILNTKPIQLPLTGITTGIPSYLTTSRIPLNKITSFPGITEEVYKTLSVVTSGKAEGRAKIVINGQNFVVERPEITNELATEIAQLITNPNIPFSIKQTYINQFIPDSISASVRRHTFLMNPANETITLKLYEKTGLIGASMDIALSNNALSKKSPAEIADIQKDFIDALTTGYKGNPTVIHFSQENLKGGTYFRYNAATQEIETKPYLDFITSFDTPIIITNLDPGFYNYSLTFSEKDGILDRLQKANESNAKTNQEKAIQDDSDVKVIKNALVERLENGEVITGRLAKPTTTTTGFDFFEANGNKVRFYNKETIISPENFPEVTVEALATGRELGLTATLKLVPKLEVQNEAGEVETKYDVIQVFVGDKLVGYVRESTNKQFQEKRDPAAAAIDTVESIANPEIPAPENTNSTVASVINNNVDVKSIPRFEDLFRKGYASEVLSKKVQANAKNWWEKSQAGKILQKYVGLEHVANLVNSDVYAKFVVSGATLLDPTNTKLATIQINPAKGSYVDVYHESWHAFSQLFLTKDQKYKLYEELRNYTDKNGKTPHADKSYRELEEILAEDFRTYAKNQKPFKEAPQKTNIFRQILEFLKTIFNAIKGKFSSKDVSVDIMSSPMIKEMFENLYFGRINEYTPLIDNVRFTELDRGIASTIRPSQDILGKQESDLVSESIDSYFSELIDIVYNNAKKSTGVGPKAASIAMLVDPEKRAWMYNEAKKDFERKLEAERAKLGKISNFPEFNSIKSLKELKDNAVGVMKSSKGEDKYIFLKSQIDDFGNLTADNKRGDRVKGESWHEIKIVADFYKHNKIKDGKKSVSIMVVNNLSDALVQLENYKAGEAKQYTEVILQQLPQPELTEEQEVILDNIRILQAAVNNWGDEKSGVIKYHMENSDYEIARKKYEVDDTYVDENGEETDELDIESKSDARDGDVLDANKTGKRSLQEMMSKETTYILKSLFKVVDGNKVKNRLGFYERADFRKTFNIVAKAIGGIADRTEAYNKLKVEAGKFPEIKQLFETKYPDPSNITNSFEFDISRMFWQDFGNKPKVQYWQVSIFPQLTTKVNPFGESKTEVTGFDIKTVQASLDTSSISARWEGDFKSSAKTKYLKKTADNKSVLDLENIVKDFGSAENLTNTPENVYKFAKAIGLNFDDVQAIKDELSTKLDFYGLDYFYKIVNAFNNLDRDYVAGKKLTTDQVEALQTFRENPIATLRADIKANVLPLFKGEKINQNTQVKRLIDLQAKYGYDSANLGVLRADGNRAYENMEYSTLFGRVDAINSAKSFEDLVKIPHMSYLSPAKNSFTKNGRSKLLTSLFVNGNGGKLNGKSLNPIFVSGTNIENVDGTNTTDLDPIGKYQQEFLSMTDSGIVELPRTSEKKSSFGLRIEGGVSKNIIENRIQKGPDQYLYVDLNMFNTPAGEEYAIKNYMVGYIATEFDRIKRFKSAERNELLRLTKYNREVEPGLVSGELFAAFDAVLTPETKDKLYKLAEDQITEELETYLKGSPLMDDIYRDVVNYFNDRVKQDVAEFGDAIKDVITPSLLTKAGIDITVEKLQITDDVQATEKLTKAYLYNDWIHKFETSMLFIGDFSQWDHSKEDWSKRIPGLTSGGYGFLFDDASLEFINTKFNANTYAKSKGLPNLQLGSSIRTAVVQDAVRSSIYLDELKEAWKEEYQKVMSESEANKLVEADAKPFNEMEESDGYAVMPLDTYRALHKMGRGWSLGQENLYQRIVAGEQVTPEVAKQFFPIYKLHYFGALGNSPIATTAMHKYAVSPLIPNLTGTNSNLDKLHELMMKNNIQYLTFNSASKGATYVTEGGINAKPDQIFKDKNFKEVVDNLDGITPNEIYLAGLKEVTVINDQHKKKIPIATQTRVINLDNLYSDGKITNADNKAAVNKYENIVDGYSNLLKEELLNEIGYEYVVDDKGVGRYQGNLKKFVQVIRDELGANGVPDHLLKIINTTQDGQLLNDLSLHPEADSVEKILMSIIYKRLIKQTTNGEPLVQAPTTFTNGSWDTQFDLLTDPKDIQAFLGTNTLPFYRRGEIDPTTGKRRATSLAKAAVSFSDNYKHLLNLKDNEGNKIETLDKLNALIKDENWLKENRLSISLFGPRIPNDATNTIEALEIWHFLNPASGNTIILPTEIVAKSGADFDADKLFLMAANIDAEGKFITEGVENFDEVYAQTKIAENNNTLKEGQPTSKQLLKIQKKHLQNEYLKASIDVLMLPDNFAFLTKPNQTYLVERYVKDLEKYSGGYNRFKNSNNLPNNKSVDGKKDVVSPTKMLEARYNIYKHDSNLSLAKSLGIQAKRTKNHVLNKMLGNVFPATYKKLRWDPIIGGTKETNIDFDFKMRFPHNKVTINGVEHISLGADKNVVGDRITDINSHNLNGILDRAKNPFPFVLKMVPEAMNVINDMIEAGVPQETVFYFVNQPMIAAYINAQRNFNSAYAFVSDPNNNYSAKTKALNAVLTPFKGTDYYDTLLKEANLMHLKDVLKDLAKGDRNKVYTFKIGKNVNDYSVSQVLNSIKKGELDMQYISKISTVPAKPEDIPVSVYGFSGNVASEDLYHYAAQILSDQYIPKGEITTAELKEALETGNPYSMKALAYFLNYIELEKQGEGMVNVQMVSTGDTVKLSTVQQITKRQDAIKALGATSKVYKPFLEKLDKESILSSFNQTQLIKDLIVPLMPLRLDTKISDYIANTLKYKAKLIKNNFGQGVKGQEFFTTTFNNAVMNFIYQNYMSNYVDADGQLTNLPAEYEGRSVVINNTYDDRDVIITDKQIIVNTKRIEQDYNAKKFLITSTAQDSYLNRGLDVFTPKQNPFPTINSYYRYVIERQYLFDTVTDEELESNEIFKRNVQRYKDGLAAFQAYISEMALKNTFNQAYIMGSTKYSYTESLLGVLSELKQSPKLVADYPIINQLSKAKIRGNFSILEFADKNNAQGAVADSYRRNLLQLADRTIQKVKDPADNARISEMFEIFPLMMFYQHGVGKSRLGFPKILDVTSYMENIRRASLNFQRNYLSENTLDIILDRIIKDKRMPVKTYGIALDAYNEPVTVNEEEIEEGFDWDEGDEKPKVNNLTGKMTRFYGKDKRSDVTANSTFDAILNGERTATTRYTDKGSIDYWKTAKVGDIITWKSADGRTLDVEVTKELAPLKGSGKTPEQWSKLEGWSIKHFNEEVKPNLDNAWQIEFKLIDSKDTTAKPINTEAASYTNHSGGAIGSDTEWDMIGRSYGMVNSNHYYTGIVSEKNAPLGNVDITDKPIAVEGAAKVADAAKEMWGYKYKTMKDQRLIRNWAQVANSDAVFAIGTLGKEGDIWKGDEKSEDPRKLLKTAVQGGTGYAVEMAIQSGKPVYVFDQVRKQWYKNINGEWSKSDVPVLTKNFAGIGTREINEAGKQAIRDVYANTFNQTTSGIKPKGEEVKAGIYLNQQALTKEEQLELFNYLKPYLEAQGAKTNKSASASKMIGLGLRWDYKNNNSGKTAVDTGDIILPASKSKYGYYDTSINNQPLAPITDRFRELMAKASGVDMTNYDGAIINLYENDTFISSHNDVDESITAIKYPVIGVNLGGDGNFSIEPRDGSPKQTLDLSPGAAYVFGVDGVNRDVYHRTFPTEQKSFLPQITTKLDGKTYPAGSYRVTVTMRRIMPITPDMPTTPGPVSDQYSDDVLSLEEQLNLLNIELADLEAQQEEAFENDPYLLIAMNLPKIKPESAYKETGVKIGVGRDINPSLLSNDGYTVQKAAHYIREFAFYEESGRPRMDEQDIRNEIIEILQVGKANYMRNYDMQYDIDQKKAEIQDIQNKINTDQGLVNLTSIQQDFGAKFKQAFIDNGNKMPDTFEAIPGKSIWALDRDTNLYSLVDNDGVILMENVSMILGRIVDTKKSNKPVSNRRKQQDLLSLNSIAFDIDMNSLMAIKGYDINDFIFKLEAAQTQSEYNEIMSKIRELLC
jgi:hypothetical protein